MCDAGLGDRLEFHYQAVPRLGTCRANVSPGDNPSWEVLSSLERPREARISLLFLKLRTLFAANSVSSVSPTTKSALAVISDMTLLEVEIRLKLNQAATDLMEWT